MQQPTASTRANSCVSTYSVVGFDPATGDLGIAVESKFLAVGAVVPHAEAGVGAVATQSWANVTFGPRGLALLRAGATAPDAVRILVASDDRADQRQLGIVDAAGRAAAHTGVGCNDYAGHKVGRHFTVQGNLLTGPEVIDDMAAAFERADGPLAERLLTALEAGRKAGGDRRGQQSSALLVVRREGGYSGFSDRHVDLRVDDSVAPVADLRKLLEKHRVTFPSRPR